MATVPSVKLNNGIEMPSLGFGVFQIAPEEVMGPVRVALEAGCRLIDTAWGYRNEECVGRAVRESGIPREQLFITTKLANSEHGYDRALRAFDASLAKLGMDYVDLYLIHWPVPMADQAHQLGEHRGLQPPRLKPILGWASGPSRSPHVLHGSPQLAVERPARRRRPNQHCVPVAVGEPAVGGGRHGYARSCQVRPGQVGTPVVGADVAVQVQHPISSGCAPAWWRASSTSSSSLRRSTARASMRRQSIFTSGARSRPTSRPAATGPTRVAPSARGSPSSARNTSDNNRQRSE